MGTRIDIASAAKDEADRAALVEFRRRLVAGEEELVPVEIINRLLSGEESRVRVWREHRGMAAGTLAQRAGIAQAYLSQIETGEREGTPEVFSKLANALGVSPDELMG